MRLQRPHLPRRQSLRRNAACSQRLGPNLERSRILRLSRQQQAPIPLQPVAAPLLGALAPSPRTLCQRLPSLVGQAPENC